jgi:hypothetical protein
VSQDSRTVAVHGAASARLTLWLRSATFSGKGWSRGLVGGGGGAWVATAGGLAMIEVNDALPSAFLQGRVVGGAFVTRPQMVPMTLEQKANQLQVQTAAMFERFS